MLRSIPTIADRLRARSSVRAHNVMFRIPASGTDHTPGLTGIALPISLVPTVVQVIGGNFTCTSQKT